MQDTNVVIVGCGFSGLLQGALLSKTSKVVMIEKNDHIGGLFNTLENNGDYIYTGAHCIGGISDRGIWKQCFDILGLKMEDYFTEIENIAVSVKGNTYMMPIKLEALKDKLSEMFPEERKINDFFKMNNQYNKAFLDNDSTGLKNMFCKLVNYTFDEFLSLYFTDELAKILLLSYIPAYAGIGFAGNAFTAVSLLVTYSIGTAYTEVNKLIDKLQQLILENGGEFCCGSTVNRIQKKDEGYLVELKNKKDQICNLSCERIVLSCYPKKIISDSFPEIKTNAYMNGLHEGPSAIRLVCKISNNEKDVATEIMSYGSYNYSEIEDNIFFKNGMKHFPICMLSMPTLEQDRKQDYTYVMFTILTYQCDVDNTVKDDLLEMLKKDMPHLFDRIIESYVFLPEYYKSIIGYDSGSVFGWERSRKTNLMTNMFSPQIKDVPGLFLAGQWSSDFGIYGGVRNALMIYEIERKNNDNN